MIKFKYPLFARFLYRYANIPISLVLLVHLLISAVAIQQEWYNVFPLLINLLILYVLNRFYLKVYRSFPFKIEVNNEKMICSDFFFSSKKIEVFHTDLDNIRGGIFSGAPTRPVYVHDGKQDVTLGLFIHIKNFNKLLTVILSNVTPQLYKELTDKMSNMKSERDKRKKK
jgi:hypothetical protein